MVTNLVINQPIPGFNGIKGRTGQGGGLTFCFPFDASASWFPNKDQQRLFHSLAIAWWNGGFLCSPPPTCRGREPYNRQGESKRFPWDVSCPTGSTVGYTAKSKTECFLQWRDPVINKLQFVWQLSLLLCRIFFLNYYLQVLPLAKNILKTPQPLASTRDRVCSGAKKLALLASMGLFRIIRWIHDST